MPYSRKVGELLIVACRFPLFKKAMKEIFKQNLIYNRYLDIKNERRDGLVIDE